MLSITALRYYWLLTLCQVSRPRILLGSEPSVIAHGLDEDFTGRSLRAANETEFSNNISKASESEAAMQTLSNYCCGPVIAPPKSCFNNMKR